MESDIATEVEAAERAVWEALRRGDRAADLAALSPDFLGVYPSGFATRADHAAQLDDGPSVTGYSLSGITVREVAPALVLIAYRACYSRTGEPEAAMYVSSLWRRGPKGWQNSFSMDCPAD